MCGVIALYTTTYQTTLRNQLIHRHIMHLWNSIVFYWGRYINLIFYKKQAQPSMSSFLTAQRAQQFEHDMQVFKKYICACSCIYDLFGLPRNHTPTPYIDFTRAHDCDDVYTPSIHSYGTPTPEVVYHRPPRDMSIPEVVVEEYSDKDGSGSEFTEPDTHKVTATNGWTEYTPYEDTLTLPPLQMSHTELTDESSEVSSVSSVTSHHSTDTTNTTDSIDIVVPDDDLPERDVWDIL